MIMTMTASFILTLLLSRFERPQYIEMHELWETDEKYKSPLETYGAEHLCRLLGMLHYGNPGLFCQTPTDILSSFLARAHLTNEHGSTVRESSAGRAGQTDGVARQKHGQILCERLRDTEFRVQRESARCLGSRCFLAPGIPCPLSPTLQCVLWDGLCCRYWGVRQAQS